MNAAAVASNIGVTNNKPVKGKTNNPLPSNLPIMSCFKYVCFIPRIVHIHSFINYQTVLLSNASLSVLKKPSGNGCSCVSEEVDTSEYEIELSSEQK